MKVEFRTNLDLHPGEKFPEWLAARPMVGDLVRSQTKWGVFQLELLVVQVIHAGNDRLEVELHLPEHQWENLYAFAQFYREKTGDAML